jgi:hypothetical protein
VYKVQFYLKQKMFLLPCTLYWLSKLINNVLVCFLNKLAYGIELERKKSEKCELKSVTITDPYQVQTLCYQNTFSSRKALSAKLKI